MSRTLEEIAKALFDELSLTVEDEKCEALTVAALREAREGAETILAALVSDDPDSRFSDEVIDWRRRVRETVQRNCLAPAPSTTRAPGGDARTGIWCPCGDEIRADDARCGNCYAGAHLVDCGCPGCRAPEARGLTDAKALTAEADRLLAEYAKKTGTTFIGRDAVLPEERGTGPTNLGLAEEGEYTFPHLDGCDTLQYAGRRFGESPAPCSCGAEAAAIRAARAAPETPATPMLDFTCWVCKTVHAEDAPCPAAPSPGATRTKETL